MPPLNEIPDYLRSDKPRKEWSYNEGLARGCGAAVVAAALVAAAMMAITYLVPFLTTFFLLQIVWGFAIAWLLFRVMHRFSGMTSLPGNLVVVLLSFLILAGIHLSFLARAIELAGVRASALANFEMAKFVTLSLGGFLGIGIALVVCKDGD